MTREISIIGDSTDGEDYELPENTLQSKKHSILAKMNEYKYKHEYKYKDTFNRLTSGSTDINVSCMLIEIGNQLLQHETVRTKYKNIKSQFISSQEQRRYNDLDELLGRGWGIIVKCYDPKKNKIAEAENKYRSESVVEQASLVQNVEQCTSNNFHLLNKNLLITVDLYELYFTTGLFVHLCVFAYT